VSTILVVDDETKILTIVRDYLERAGFSVASATDATAALATARRAKPALIVLDLGLPGGDGLDVARSLRRDSDVPIIMLTARGDESDRVTGLELGADDYIVKPFSPKELVARVRAVLRRWDGARAGTKRIRVSDVLTASEFQLLTTLARQPGRVFTRGQLLEAIHGVAFESYERAIDAHIKNIRRKMEAEPGQPHYILTVHGVGYKFNDT
jgi:DNA-binding response OmpR family regulator